MEQPATNLAALRRPERVPDTRQAPAPGVLAPAPVPLKPKAMRPRDLYDAFDALAERSARKLPICPDCGPVTMAHPTKPGATLRYACKHQIAEADAAQALRERDNVRRSFWAKFGQTLPAQAHAGARMASVDDRPAKARAKRAALAYLANWEQIRAEGEGMFLVGDRGTGKSYLAAAIAGELEDQGYTTAFAVAAEIPRIFRDKVRRDTFPQMVEAADLVVLDDLGADEPFPSDIADLFTIIDLRFRAKKPLIVTSNFGADALQAHYVRCQVRWGVGAEEAEEMVGRQLSRLRECCASFAFIGADQRGEGRHAWAKDL